MFKVIVAGGRDFDDYERLCREMDYLLQNIQESIEIVCGGATGADELGKKYAYERGYAVQIFPADWKCYGRAAGPIRNEQMAMYADALVAYWNGSSRGTKSMIDLARKHGLKIRIKQY